MSLTIYRNFIHSVTVKVSKVRVNLSMIIQIVVMYKMLTFVKQQQRYILYNSGVLKPAYVC